MKKLITFILVIFSVTNSYAQDRVTDSLKQLLSKEKTDLAGAGLQACADTLLRPRLETNYHYLSRFREVGRPAPVKKMK